MTSPERPEWELCRRCGAALTVIPGGAVPESGLCFFCRLRMARQHKAYLALVERVAGLVYPGSRR